MNREYNEGQSLTNQKVDSRTRMNYPSIIYGTSGIGNLYTSLKEEIKREIIKECFLHSKGKVVFDSAGKYGAGLALESLGNSLRVLNIKPDDVVISNKLGWLRTPLKTPEPTFEPGVWKALEHDAIQKISYDGILECFEQGNELLGGYIPQLVSVHDPDEYLAKANNEVETEKLYNDILDAYKALQDLKAKGVVRAIGVGAKDWRIIEKISKDIELDWVMIANSMTIQNHPEDLWMFMQSLADENIKIFNSAIFHSGFLTGGNYYDYKFLNPADENDKTIFKWREGFFSLCREFMIKPAEACAQFSLRAPGVVSIVLSTTNPQRVMENAGLINAKIPNEFWEAMKAKGLLGKNIM